MTESENKFEALVDKIKGNRNMSEFAQVNKLNKLTEVILDGDYTNDMITYSYLVDFYNLVLPVFKDSEENENLQIERVYELARNISQGLNEHTRSYCETIFEFDHDFNTSKKLKKFCLNKSEFDIPFKDIHEFVDRYQIGKKNGGKSKSNKTRKTNKRKKTKTKKRRKIKSKTNKRKKRTRRRR